MNDPATPNHFARFGIEPCPWIDQEQVKQRFLQLSAEVHPDKALDKSTAERAFTELNASYNVLRNTRARLLHLLELSGAAAEEHVQDVPTAALDFFAKVAALTKSVDALLRKKAAANSPMLKVQLMSESLAELEKVQELQDRIRAKISAIEADLAQLSGAWPPAQPEEGLKFVREAAAALGFLERWNSQLQERAARLTF